MNAATKRVLSPEDKIARLPEDARCEPDCPTWRLVNAGTDPEIQRCDACWQNTPNVEQLTDTEASSLVAARMVLHTARTSLAVARRLAISNRRTALVDDACGTLISPCCRALVTMRGLSITLYAFDIEHDIDGSPILRTTVMSKPARNAAPDMVEPDTAVCSKCGRLLQLPAGFEAVL